MAWSTTADPERFDEAVEWFRRRIPATDELIAEWGPETLRRAFLVAGVAELDVVAAIYVIVGQTIERGDGLDEFKRRAKAEIARWRARGDRLETVYRTNIQTAYNRGRYHQMTRPAVKRLRPFWMYDAVLDSLTSDICRPRNGVVRRADDAWWNGNHPPLHHRCRSALRTLTRRQAEWRGITSDDDLPDTEPGEGFGGLPSLDEWEPDPSKYPPELWDIHERRSTA